MTISTTTSRAEYAGNGVTTVFAFPYPFFADGDLAVLLLRSTGVVDTLMLNTDYTVSGEGTPSSGQVTLTIAPAVGESLFILRELGLTQETDYISGDPFPAESHERALDRLTLIAQQLQEQIDRSVTLPEIATGVSTQLPLSESNALIGWNTAANALQNYAGTSSALVSSAMAPVVAAATLADARSELGATVVGNALFTAASVNAAQSTLRLRDGADIASAATLNLTGRTGNIVRVTGTTPVTTLTMNNGDKVLLVADGALPISVTGVLQYLCTAGDTVLVWQDGGGVQHASVLTPIGRAQIQAIPTPSFNAGAMTIPAQKYTLDFQNPATGAVTTVSAEAAAMVVPSGATLGLTSGAQSDLALLGLLPSAGAIEHAVVNLAGGVDLSESGVISTTALSTGSDSANVVYSTTARTNVQYRVLGRLRSTQTTAGTWAQAMTAINGTGGLFRVVSPSRVRLHTSNGYGSTNTCILRFSTVVENLGSDITYADSATLGASFTINTPGLYAVSGVYHNAATAGHFGISLNSTQLTTSISLISATNRLPHSSSGNTANCDLAPSVTYYFNAGDVIRPHADGNNTGAAGRAYFSVCRVT